MAAATAVVMEVVVAMEEVKAGAPGGSEGGCHGGGEVEMAAAKTVVMVAVAVETVDEMGRVGWW